MSNNSSNNNNREAVSATESGSFVAHSAAELAYKFYYERDRKGLEMLTKDLEAVLSHTKNCIDCLDFLNSQGESFAKIYLLLEYMGRKGISEEFVNNLEELAERARECLDNDEEMKLDADEEFDLIRRLNSTMDRHERDYRNEELRLSLEKAANA